MRRVATGLPLLLLLLSVPAAFPADGPAKPNPREALRPLNDLIGAWHGIGQPEGSAETKRKGAWEETIRWEWQFKDGDAWLKVEFDKGKHFTDGTLRYLPEKEQFQLALNTADKQSLTFTGPLKDYKLILERQDETTKDTQRVVISLLQDNRFVYHYEVQPAGRSLSRKVYVVGATKEGKPLVKESDEVGPLCVVSYGPAVSPVTYKGKTYYVCCGSCRTEFRNDPEKYIKEYEEYIAKLVKEKAEKNKKP